VKSLKIEISINPEETLIIISDFIKTYIQNSNAKGVIIGLSGGLDSSVTAIICQKIFGKKNTNCIFLPDNVTPELDINHIKDLVNKFNLNLKERNIECYIKNINELLLKKYDNNALANVKARLRMLILYEYANMTNNIVCGTSNKSELLVGYFTKYGDGGVDINPLGDLYKSQIYELAKYLKIPSGIIKKAPTAGLIEGQTDETDLRINYGDLDLVLAGLEKKMDIMSISEITQIKISEIKRIKKMITMSQHKRRFSLIPKLGLRTPGLDWRIPIQHG
jgi:NAD+ synthase